MPSTCPQCGASFPCNPAGKCWCMALPPTHSVPAPQTAATCLCPACLKALAAVPASK